MASSRFPVCSLITPASLPPPRTHSSPGSRLHLLPPLLRCAGRQSDSLSTLAIRQAGRLLSQQCNQTLFHPCSFPPMQSDSLSTYGISFPFHPYNLEPFHPCSQTPLPPLQSGSFSTYAVSHQCNQALFPPMQSGSFYTRAIWNHSTHAIRLSFHIYNQISFPPMQSGPFSIGSTQAAPPAPAPSLASEAGRHRAASFQIPPSSSSTPPPLPPLHSFIEPPSPPPHPASPRHQLLK